MDNVTSPETDSNNKSLGLNTLAHGIQAVLYGWVTERIYSKYKYSLEPIHVYELNNLSNWALLAGFNIFTVFDVFFEDSDIFCTIGHFGLNYIIFSFYMGIVITQIDRFLVIYWSVKYKSRATTTKALKTIIISKVVLFIITLVIALVDGQILRCFSTSFYGCRMLERNIWINFSMFFTLITVLVVSIYVLYIIKKQSTRVTPTVNIKTISEIANNKDDQEDIEAEDVSGNGEESDGKKIKTREIKRRSTDPYMFYRESQSDSDLPVVSIAFKCFEASIFEPTKRILKINLATLTLLIMMVPHNLLNVYFHFSEEGCSNNIVNISRLVGLAQYLFVIIYPFILMSKLSKCSP